MPFIPLWREDQGGVRTAALHNIKLPTLGFIRGQLRLDHEEITIQGRGIQSLPPLLHEGVMGRFLISAIRFYQTHLSGPYMGACIYTPSCSEYSVEAIERYGAWRGLGLSVRRLMRCRPPYRGGHDPVPL